MTGTCRRGRRLGAALRGVFVLALLCLLQPLAVRAEDPPKPAKPANPEAAALDSLLRRGDGRPDDAALAALLADGTLDAWLLVQHARAWDFPDVARRLASLADEAQVGPLRRCLEALEQGRTVDALEARLEAGELALEQGRWQRAKLRFSKALQTAFATGSYDHAARAAEGVRAVVEAHEDEGKLAGAEFDLALIAQHRGDLPRAIRHVSEAIHLYELLDRPQDAVEPRSLRSHWYAEIGDFAAALDDQRLQQAWFRDRQRDAAWAQNQRALGLIRYRLGDGRGAVAALEAGLATAEALEDHDQVLEALVNLGLTHMQAGEYDEAVASYRRALASPAAKTNAYGQVTAKLNLSYALKARAEAAAREAPDDEDAEARRAREERREADLAGALTLLAEVRTVAEQADATGLALLARLGQAELLAATGKLETARTGLRAVANEAGRLRAWHPHLRASVRLAEVLLRLDDVAAALRVAGDAADELARSHAGLASVDLARARALHPDVYDIGVRAAVREERTEDFARFLESGRAAALLRGLGGRAAALRASVPLVRQTELEAKTRARLQAFVRMRRAERRGGLLQPIRDARAAHDKARREEQEVVEAIERVREAAAGRLAPTSFASIRDVQGRLRPRGRPELRTVFVAFNLQPDAGFALVIEPRKARPVSYPAADMPGILEALDVLAASPNGELDEAALDTLKAKLLEPLDIPDGPTRLLVSPDRSLAYAPLSAVLPDDWELAWVPSGTTLDLLAEGRLSKGRGVLGVGDPDYRGVRDKDVFKLRGGAELVRLPSAGAEIEAVASGKDDVALTQARATEGELAKVLAPKEGKTRRWRSVHFACHGLVDVEQPAFCCLALTPGEGEDGLLTASEILRLSMPTDLAVLSACQTGRGSFVRGEGVMGLTRAFMFAGAARVLVSLWNVEDEATSHLMRAFYRFWNEGNGAARALRLAQQAVRDHEVETTVEEDGKPPRKVKTKPWADPRYWAAWSLWGLPD